MRDSELSVLCRLDNIAILLKYAESSWDTNSWISFFDLHWDFIHRKKWHPGTSEISTPPKIIVGTHFHAQDVTKTTSVFLPADGEASWSPLSSLVSLLSGSTVQPENIYSCILKVTGQAWENQKIININISHSYHQLLSLPE